MHPARALVLGLACLLSSQAGCISLVAFRSVLQSTVEQNGEVSDAVSRLDDACQVAQSTQAGLASCRGPRDRARAALRKQLAGLAEVLR